MPVVPVLIDTLKKFLFISSSLLFTTFGGSGILLNPAAIRDDASKLRVSMSTFLLLRINRLMRGERWA